MATPVWLFLPLPMSDYDAASASGCSVVFGGGGGDEGAAQPQSKTGKAGVEFDLRFVDWPSSAFHCHVNCIRWKLRDILGCCNVCLSVGQYVWLTNHPLFFALRRFAIGMVPVHTTYLMCNWI